MDLLATGTGLDMKNRIFETNSGNNSHGEGRSDSVASSKPIDRNQLKDIHSVVIDPSKPCEERVRSFVEQIGNPYCYLDNGIVVEVGYADTDISLQDRLSAYAASISRNPGK